MTEPVELNGQTFTEHNGRWHLAGHEVVHPRVLKKLRQDGNARQRMRRARAEFNSALAQQLAREKAAERRNRPSASQIAAKKQGAKDRAALEKRAGAVLARAIAAGGEVRKAAAAAKRERRAALRRAGR